MEEIVIECIKINNSNVFKWKHSNYFNSPFSSLMDLILTTVCNLDKKDKNLYGFQLGSFQLKILPRTKFVFRTGDNNLHLRGISLNRVS